MRTRRWRPALPAAAAVALVCGSVLAAGASQAASVGSRRINVMVISYDPVLRTRAGQRLSQYMKWNDARAMTDAVVDALREASGGYAGYHVVDFRTVDAYPVKRDGYQYDERGFLEMWGDRDRAHQPDTVSYAAIFRRFGIERKVRRGEIQEVWLWGAPYFGWDEYAMKIPGDRIYYPTDNPWFYRPYDIPDCGRTVWVMGFNYERGVAEAVHSFGHRVEGILSLTVGRGIWDDKRTPDNIWNRFTHQAKTFADDAQVGNVHGGPNAEEGYDYAQKRTVMSGANNWLRYPDISGPKQPVSCETWGGPDYHLNYMKWWLGHLPKAPGVTDGFYNNWWRYVVDYDAAVRALPPPGGRLAPANSAMR